MEGSLITPMAEMHLETILERPSHPPLIFALPRELLIYILELVQASEWLYPGFETCSQTRESRWHRFSLICRVWRVVILESPSLWRLIEFSSARWTRLMLERSGDMSIDVCYSLVEHDLSNEFQSDDIANMHVILDNIHRMRRLLLLGVAVQLLFRYATAPLAVPLLKILRLDANNSRGWARWRPSIQEAPFSETNQLYDLRLTDTIILPSSLLFRPNVTRLEISKYRAPVEGYTLNQMMDILKNMPFLKDLFLAYSMADFSSDYSITDSISPSAVVLPQLEALQLTSKTLLECAIFMRHVSLPQTTFIHLECDSETSQGTILPFSYLPPKRLGGLDPLPHRKIVVRYDSIFSQISSYPSAIDKHPSDTGSWLIMKLPHPELQDADAGIAIARLLGPLGLQSVTSLVLSTSEDFMDWSPILSVMHAVEEIEFPEHSWQPIASSLLIDVLPDADDDLAPRMRMLCPRLRRLEFNNGFEMDTVGLEFFEVLATVLDERQESGLLVEAIVQGERVTSRELRSLEEMKRKKVWKLVKQ